MREARARGEKPPPYVPEPFDDQVRVVMDHVKGVVEAAGSNMDCLLKVIVWLKDQTKAEAFDRIYRAYFSSPEALPTRTRMQAGRTPMDCELEVEAIGYIPGETWGAPVRTQRAAKARKGREEARKRWCARGAGPREAPPLNAQGCPGRRAIGAPPGRSSLCRKLIRPFDRSYGDISSVTLSPARMRMRCLRIFPEA
jgi:hypothetical protein